MQQLVALENSGLAFDRCRNGCRRGVLVVAACERVRQGKETSLNAHQRSKRQCNSSFTSLCKLVGAAKRRAHQVALRTSLRLSQKAGKTASKQSRRACRSVQPVCLPSALRQQLAEACQALQQALCCWDCCCAVFSEPVNQNEAGTRAAAEAP